MYILLYKGRYTYYILFLCFYREEGDAEHQKQADQLNIMLNNPSTITPTSDEEMRHTHNSNDDNILCDEY